jgi:hypothetical protein
MPIQIEKEPISFCTSLVCVCSLIASPSLRVMQNLKLKGFTFPIRRRVR